MQVVCFCVLLCSPVRQCVRVRARKRVHAKVHLRSCPVRYPSSENHTFPPTPQLDGRWLAEAAPITDVNIGRSNLYAPPTGLEYESDISPAYATPRNHLSTDRRVQRPQRSDLVYVSPSRHGGEATTAPVPGWPGSSPAQRFSAVPAPAAWVHLAPADSAAVGEGSGDDRIGTSAAAFSNGDRGGGGSLQRSVDGGRGWAAPAVSSAGHGTWIGGEWSGSDLGAARFEAALQRIRRGVSKDDVSGRA